MEKPNTFNALVRWIRLNEALPRWVPGRLPMLAAAGGSHGLNPLLAMVVALALVTIGSILIVPLGQALPDLPYSAAFWVEVLAQFVGLCLVVFAFVLWGKRRGTGVWGAVALFGRGWARELLLGLLVGLGLLAMVAVPIWLSGALSFSRPDAAGVAAAAASMVLLSAITFAVQGSAEEILIRGWLMPELITRIGVWAGVLISSAAFSALHVGNESIGAVALLNIFIFGLFLALLVIARGSLWAACGVHMAWNWALSVGLGIEVSGVSVPTRLLISQLDSEASELLTGGAFGLEASLLTTFAMGLAGLISFGLARRNGRWADLQAQSRAIAA